MRGTGAGFGRLARWYRALEFAAFGRDLERARFEYLGRLSGCRNILLLGEGDGRCAARRAEAAQGARILCVDSSPGMIERASRRIAGSEAAGRVEFLCADARSLRPAPGSFDGVATLFFLDCLDDRGVASVVAQTGAALAPGSSWLFADFRVPAGGLARLRARAWLAVLYAFFRAATGLGTSRLPRSEEILGEAGWTRVASRDFQGGLVRSAVFTRPPG